MCSIVLLANDLYLWTRNKVISILDDAVESCNIYNNFLLTCYICK